MRFEVGIDGRTWTMDVEPRDGALAVSVDGRVTLVDAVPVGGGLSLILPERGRESLDVGIETSAPGELMVHVGGASIPVTVQPSGRAQGRRRSSMAAAAGARKVTAPMPGRIVRVLIEKGQPVEARQGLVVIEAMKMENELKAPKAGVVTAIAAAEGTTVEAGAVLVVIE
jgi:biotin carboxyl carrier protein